MEQDSSCNDPLINDSASNASSDDDDDNSLILDPTSILSLEELKKHSASVDATGVVYLSRIPPFMKPTKLRSLLSKYGKLGRIYLAPEDAKITAKRKKYKHNKRINYTEGWVEFLDKKVARATANHLNNTIIGGKKRSYYHDDLWMMKYLPKFKWNDLTEQIAYELKVKDQKLKNELAQTLRENKIYMKNVEKAKMIHGIQEKKSKTTKVDQTSLLKKQRTFKQRPVLQNESATKMSILSRIFS